MTRLLVACCVVLAGCAGHAPPPVLVTPVGGRVETSTGAGVVNLARSAETIGVPVSLKASPDTVFATLLAVYRELGIATTRLDRAQRVAGNDMFKARRRLAGVAMQTYADCGGKAGQPNAETFDMELGVVSQVTPTPQGSTIVTTLIAAGSDPMFGRDRQMRCVSTGEFERRIAAMVRDRLGIK